MFALDLDLLADRFTVRHAGFFERGFDVEFCTEFRTQHVQLLFAETGKDDLMGFRIVADGEHRIFILKLVQAGDDLVLFAFGLRPGWPSRGREPGI